MSRTREQLIARALNKLGAVGAGQSPEAEDSALIDDALDSVVADLTARGIYSWADPDEIEDAAYEHLAQIVAVACARDFGKEPDEGVRQVSEARLRQINPVTLSGRPQPAEFI